MYPLSFGGSRPRLMSRTIFDQHFAIGLSPEDILTALPVPYNHHHYFRTWRVQSEKPDTGDAIKYSRGKYQIVLDVQHFVPGEIVVKVAGGTLIVEASHEDRKDDHGLVSRSFKRRYRLPESVIEDSITCELDSHGALTITATKVSRKSKKERIVPIKYIEPTDQPSEEGQA